MATPTLHPGQRRNFHHLRGRYPGVARREDRQRFWVLVAEWLSSEEATMEVGISQPIGTRSEEDAHEGLSTTRKPSIEAGFSYRASLSRRTISVVLGCQACLCPPEQADGAGETRDRLDEGGNVSKICRGHLACIVRRYVLAPQGDRAELAPVIATRTTFATMPRRRASSDPSPVLATCAPLSGSTPKNQILGGVQTAYATIWAT